MVRINLIDPTYLADQHLVAEYDEILMLLGYVRKYPALKEVIKKYTLGKGHILFFKDKLLYLKRRHEHLKEEMRKRGFQPDKIINLKEFPKALKNDYTPTKQDIKTIKTRLKEKLQAKPDVYRYYGEEKPATFFLALLKRA